MSTPSTAPAAPKAAGAAPANAAADSANELVRIYNRTRKIFTHEIYLNDKLGRTPAKYSAAPNAHCTVPRWLAEMWMKMFPDEVISGDMAMRAIDGTQAALIESEEKAKRLEQEKKALEDELAEMRAKLAGERKPAL